MKVKSLVLGIDARPASRGAREWKSATDEVAKGGKKAERSVRDMGDSFKSFKSEIFSLKGALAGLATGVLAVTAKRAFDLGVHIITRILDGDGEIPSLPSPDLGVPETEFQELARLVHRLADPIKSSENQEAVRA